MQKDKIISKLYAYFLAGIIAFGISGNAIARQKGNEDYHKVQARKNAKDTSWQTYFTKTVDRLPGFDYSTDPKTSVYGGWTTFQLTRIGFFRVEKKDDRWWIIDPDGYPFIHKKIVNSNFQPYQSLPDNMKQLNDHVYELIQYLDK